MGNDYLRKLQLTEKEILDEIVRICEDNSLNYYLIGGTLLGAVRHKGFIPWDDDLDIVMPRKDYDKFRKLCVDGALKEKYHLHSLDTDPEYWLIFAKVRKKNTLFNEKNIACIEAPKGIYVDIFPLDEARSVAALGKRIRTKIIKWLSMAIYRRRGLQFTYGRTKEIALAFLSMFSIKTISAIQNWLMQFENGKGGEYYVNYGSNYETEKQTMLKTVYEPAGQIEFEGTMYKCPRDYEYVLCRIYGENYMTLPPVEKRITHQPVAISFDLQADMEANKGE